MSHRHHSSSLAALAALSLVVTPACGGSKEEAKKDPAPTQAQTQAEAAPTAAAAPKTPPPAAAAIERGAFNAAAIELNLPLFWRNDDNGNNTLDPTELVVTWTAHPTNWGSWVKDGAFTEAFNAAFAQVVAHSKSGFDTTGLDDAEKARREKVLLELNQVRPTLIYHDFSGASAQDKGIVENILKAAALIEKLHAKQIGSWELHSQIAKGDTASAALFNRNQGPWCTQPKTEKDPDCSALPSKPKRISGMYPKDIQADDNFCANVINKAPNAAELRGHFNIVVKDGDGLKAVPYTEAYKEEMTAISDALKAAAASITEGEEAFKAYLLADAQAFLDNNWDPANEAWAKMNTENSKFYLRLGPDETYFEPCADKAGFHVSFALTTPDTATLKKTLEPVKNDMEKAVAKLAGKPYKARKIEGNIIPDSIDIILNAGNSRSPSGATIGQSLPNWGPVANEGRGRTVAMTTLYSDVDSKKARDVQMAAMLCKDSVLDMTGEPGFGVMGTLLHEMAHNMGPAHEYKVRGKTDDEIFGGPLAAMLEELKAQTTALYFTEWLAKKKLLDEEKAKKAHLQDINWTFGHISRGMYTPTGKPKAYSQLAAIQVGALMDAGALVWRADEKAANGTDVGCLSIHRKKLPAAIEKLEKRVLKIKAKGNRKDAERLVKEWVDGKKVKALHQTITERVLRNQKSSFVYSIKL